MRSSVLGGSILGSAALGVGLLLSAPAQAEEQSTCADASNTIEIGECVRKAYDKADAELNAVWSRIMAAFKKSVDYMPEKDRKAWKDELLAAQRNWVQFKEHDCETVVYEWWGGSGASNAVMFCRLDHTVARTRDLKARYLDQ